MPRMLWEGRWQRWLVALAVLVAVGAAGWYAVARSKVAAQSPPSETTNPGSSISVEVISPRPGGIDRLCLQPGSLEPLEAADLYAKVSGFLVEQKVDIGSHVRAGELLARLSVPEFDKQVKHDTADVERAKSRVDQMKAAITTAVADHARRRRPWLPWPRRS